MPLDRSDIHTSLKTKGFEVREGDHTFFTYHTTQGKKTPIFTKTSHGKNHKVIGNDILSAMSKQCRLTLPLFKELIECTLSREGYEENLVKNGHVTLDDPRQTGQKDLQQR